MNSVHYIHSYLCGIMVVIMLYRSIASNSSLQKVSFPVLVALM